ncbi:BQ5605_C017g08553 [Microbotryum silenes-dioicae]|uniref:BQ5605_C017g08553 protein n=1 Tax=Microbotryum silenes-dioicae TaxID=796604 RepID=A0A2X0NZ70_9BASI|nr:BQ5605_C017g08553 [Microbotryum silenes-dioicae]
MRANLGFLSTILAFQELDLWQLLTYTAGVSGSCWALASLYTLPIARDHRLSTKSVNRVREAHGGYQSLFGPLISKSKNSQKICMIDLYSTLVSSYFWMMPRKDGKDQVDPASMKWSRAYDNAGLAHGCAPFPIVSHANVGFHLERCLMA